MRTSRRQVRCTLCTSHRWKGNARERFKAREADARARARREIRER